MYLGRRCGGHRNPAHRHRHPLRKRRGRHRAGPGPGRPGRGRPASTTTRRRRHSGTPVAHGPTASSRRPTGTRRTSRSVCSWRSSTFRRSSRWSTTRTMDLFRRIGVNTMRNPQRLIAEHLYRSVARPAIADYIHIGDDAEVFEVAVTGDAPTAGKTLIQANERVDPRGRADRGRRARGRRPADHAT